MDFKTTKSNNIFKYREIYKGLSLKTKKNLLHIYDSNIITFRYNKYIELFLSLMIIDKEIPIENKFKVIQNKSYKDLCNMDVINLNNLNLMGILYHLNRELYNMWLKKHQKELNDKEFTYYFDGVNDKKYSDEIDNIEHSNEINYIRDRNVNPPYFLLYESLSNHIHHDKIDIIFEIKEIETGISLTIESKSSIINKISICGIEDIIVEPQTKLCVLLNPDFIWLILPNKSNSQIPMILEKIYLIKVL